ncbi:Hsp20/alpha crystallin family protein [Fluviicola sp.]|uniref:Hsp20/alpha crystallin family protein n=1 Tax=Fluviicola sp. TaxID=1917219 RepID=UPI0031D8702D
MNSVKTSKDEELTAPNWSDFFADRVFSNRWPFHKMELFPAVNIKESDDAFHTEMAVPGFSKKDFKIDVDGSYLTISADKTRETNESNERYTKKEFESKSFSRTFNLPENVDADNIEATYQEGILQLIIPKKEKRKPTLKKKIRLS